jgi:CRISPR system Cascade subunit CasC
VQHYEKLLAAYELESDAIALDLTETIDSSNIKTVNMISDIVFR